MTTTRTVSLLFLIALTAASVTPAERISKPLKVVSEFPGTWSTMYPYPKKGQWELYDIQADRTELNDLSRRRPEVLTAMVASYEAWAKRIGVVPWGELEGKQE